MTLLEQPALFGESIAVDESAPRPTGTGSKSGRKSVAEDSPIPWRGDLDGVESLDWFTRTYLLVPRGYGAGAAMWLRPRSEERRVGKERRCEWGRWRHE